MCPQAFGSIINNMNDNYKGNGIVPFKLKLNHLPITCELQRNTNTAVTGPICTNVNPSKAGMYTKTLPKSITKNCRLPGSMPRASL